MAACYPGFELPAARHKDYSRPLHVDCSVEYELPNQAKPPEGARSEPLLMIHPCYYRRAESQRRSPFINNLPRPGASASVGRRVGTAASAGAVAAVPPQQSGASRLLPPPWATAAPKRDPLLCGDLTSTSADSGHWTDTERSPADARLHRDFAPDSGIATPVSLADDKAVLSGEETRCRARVVTHVFSESGAPLVLYNSIFCSPRTHMPVFSLLCFCAYLFFP